MKTLSPGSWTCSSVAGSPLPASQFLTAVCAMGRPLIFFCGYSHARGPQCRGFKLNWKFSRTESVVLRLTFLQPEPRPCCLRPRKPSDTLFDLLLQWFLCNQWCCCCNNETQETRPFKPLEWKELGIWSPKVLFVFQHASPPTRCGSLGNI